MNASKIAEAIKAHLVSLAVNDKLPMDMNDLSESALEKVIESTLPSKRDLMIERAEHLLSDGELSTAEMIEAIDKHEDENELIDYVEGVNVWEKVEYSFTCEQFLSEIGFDKDFYNTGKKKKRK